MAFVEPVVLRDRGVRLEPLTTQHEAGLRAAAADGELWRLRVTSVPEPEQTRAYIDTALQARPEGSVAFLGALPFGRYYLAGYHGDGRPEGQAALAEQDDALQQLLGRLSEGRRHERHQRPAALVRALENFKTALRLKLDGRPGAPAEPLTDAQVKAIAAVLDHAALQVEAA